MSRRFFYFLRCIEDRSFPILITSLDFYAGFILTRLHTPDPFFRLTSRSAIRSLETTHCDPFA